MLNFYSLTNEALRLTDIESVNRNLEQLRWVDLLDPSQEEEQIAEQALGIDVPTRREMHDIELSSRLYIKNNTLYATATLVTTADTLDPETHAVTFMLKGNCLVTVRYVDPQPFRAFADRIGQNISPELQGTTIFISLLELISDRLADILEKTGHTVDGMTKKVFRWKQKGADGQMPEKPDFETILMEIGIAGDLVSKTRESLVSMNRLAGFVSQTPFFKAGSEEYARLKTRARDIDALSDHATFLANKVNFLLDATMSMINNEQNAIIKIFSVAAVVFLPPTLVASIYGMNFGFMPELEWRLGYPLAIVMMILSGYLPYRYFKRRKWL